VHGDKCGMSPNMCTLTPKHQRKSQAILAINKHRRRVCQRRHASTRHPATQLCLPSSLPVQPAIAIVDVESGETGSKSVGEVRVHHARAHTQPRFDNPPSWVSAIWTNVKSALNDVSPRPGASGRPRPVALCSAMVCSPSIRAAKKIGRTKRF
jgi:hypothetical protein